jgi:hypothetical protein
VGIANTNHHWLKSLVAMPTLLSTYTRTGKKFQGREIYKDGNGRYYHVDNFQEGWGSEIEYYNPQGKHLGTLKPDGTPKDGPVKGRTLPDNL